jgi:hypothetical protein
MGDSWHFTFEMECRMSLARFIYCTCLHDLESHVPTGCVSCACGADRRRVIDVVLDHERDAIHRAWLTPPGHPTATAKPA